MQRIVADGCPRFAPPVFLVYKCRLGYRIILKLRSSISGSARGPILQ